MGIVQQVQEKLLDVAYALARVTVEEYIADIREHIGSIPGDRDYSDEEVSWTALDEDGPLGDNSKFWYETGAVANNLFLRIAVENNRVIAKAGIALGADGYREALWNELGFMPGNSDKIVKRPLFLPLAEHHLAELQERLTNKFRATKLRIRIRL